MIRTGVRWRIGSGSKANITGLPWLLHNDNPYITTESETLVNNKLDSLFQMDKKYWDREIIIDLFNDKDQRCIMEIPLREVEDEDIIFWSLENSGMYSVKSAYNLLQ